MTPEEADARIIKSRQTLAVYTRMVAAGMKLDADLGLMEAEIRLLTEIAEKHPAKAAKITALAGRWRQMVHDIAPRH